MQNLTSGIKPVSPSYPVRPVQPVNKDRKTGDRKQPGKRPTDDDDGIAQDDTGEDKPLVDEHV